MSDLEAVVAAINGMSENFSKRIDDLRSDIQQYQEGLEVRMTSAIFRPEFEAVIHATNERVKIIEEENRELKRRLAQRINWDLVWLGAKNNWRPITGVTLMFLLVFGSHWSIAHDLHAIAAALTSTNTV
jgi:hypothetical protein